MSLELGVSLSSWKSIWKRIAEVSSCSASETQNGCKFSSKCALLCQLSCPSSTPKYPLQSRMVPGKKYSFHLKTCMKEADSPSRVCVCEWAGVSVIISFRRDYVCDEASWAPFKSTDPDSRGSLSSSGSHTRGSGVLLPLLPKFCQL